AESTRILLRWAAPVGEPLRPGAADRKRGHPERTSHSISGTEPESDRHVAIRVGWKADSSLVFGQAAADEAGSKHLQTFLLIALDDKELVQFGNLEHLANLRVNVAKHELAARRLHLLVQGDELAQSSAGHVLHVAEIKEKLLAPRFVHQTEKLLADNLNVLLVQDFSVCKTDHSHIADVFHFQTAAFRRLRRHKGSPLDPRVSEA